MRGLIAKKVGMSQIFDDDGSVVPVTILQAGPCSVAQLKTVDNDGYDEIEIHTNHSLIPDFPIEEENPFITSENVRFSLYCNDDEIIYKINEGNNSFKIHHTLDLCGSLCCYKYLLNINHSVS